MDIQIYKYINRIEFRKINFLGDKTNQLVTFKTKKWFEETDDKREDTLLIRKPNLSVYC